MITRANVQDAKQVYAIIRKHAAKNVVLPRPLVAVYEHIREFFVYRAKGKIIGIVALHIVWEDMAEVRSLVVDARHRKKGIGRKLVQKTLEEAANLNIPNVFALTREADFFKRLGFKRVAKNKLPQKVWKDCINCPLFPDCDEVPVIFRLNKNALQK
ncbi:MAG: N-acetyltransferase [Elusimicrobiota bacterium]|nr:N-acetyltransferase [Elusimicrobiota bacterium]